MPILRPDEYKHGNANLAFLDSDFVRGGIRVVASTDNLTDSAMEAKVDQLKDNATLVYVTGSSVFYRLKSKANITSLTDGWEEIDLTGTDGADGLDGQDGADGADGNTVLNGAGAPASETGTDGDFYIDTSNNDIYGPKTSGSWGSSTSLIGPAGENGQDGADGIDGVNGIDGADGNTILSGSGAPNDANGEDGDFYIDTSNNNIHGPKSSGSWPSGVSIVGADGADGIDGTNGTDGADGVNGDSAYDIWLDAGNTGTEANFLASLIGADGADGLDGADGAGFTGGSYDADTGIVTFTGDGDLGFTTSDLRGADGADGADGSDYTYTNATTMPEAVGGISAGTSFSSASLDDIFDSLLYPYQSPSFSTSWSVPFSTSTKEVGESIVINGNYTFTLNVSSNVQANTLELKTGGTTATTESIVSGQSTTSPLTVTGQSDVSFNYKTTRYYKLFADDTNGNTFSSSFKTTRWYWRVFWGESTSTSLDESGIEAFGSSLESDNLKTYDFEALDQGYKYFAFPSAYAAPSSFKDSDSNTDIPLVGSSGDAIYNNEDSNGNFYAEVSVTNSHSVTATYRVYRTFNALGGALSITVA